LYDARTTGIALREQSLKLRALLQNGANESLYFRRRLPSYTMAVVSLVHLLQASLDLFRRQKGKPQYLDDVGTELFAVHEAVSRELQMLGDSKPPPPCSTTIVRGLTCDGKARAG
jgi:hypothetical protein